MKVDENPAAAAPEQAAPTPEQERRKARRSRIRGVRDWLYSTLRFISRHVAGFWGALAAFLTVGLAVGLAAAAIFAAFATAVRGGITQQFDETVLRWLAARRTPQLDFIMLEITSLGNGIVVIMIISIAAVFLWLTKHRWSVYILLVGVLGGKFLNTLLKGQFNRERPSVIEHVDVVHSLSFPSGHAMGALVAYGSVAYLVGRLEPTAGLRRTTWGIAILLIMAIGVSRMYLGVHYPSDVIGGFLAGMAWLAFVASSVTAVRFFAPRRPETRAEEHDLNAERERAAGVRQ
jgi:membrane-associated phospholipid phosphatase